MGRIDYFVKYGRGSLNFSVPEKNLLKTLKIKEVAKITDIEQKVRQVLENPIGTKALKEIVKPGEKVAIVVNDITRVVNTKEFLPHIANYLNECDISDDDIYVVVATGLHRTHTAAEHRYIVGDEMYERVKIYDHVGTDMDNMDYLGVTKAGTEVYINKLITQADRVILTGEVTYHLIAGYTGGRKSVLPGVAGSKTITQNHRFMLDERSRTGCIENNPLHLDMLEAARLLNPDFIFNIILDKDRDFVYMVTGDLEKAHAEGRRFVDEIFKTEISEPADVVISNCGGYPKDIEFYQAQKTLDNAMWAVKEGGTVILLAECSEGVGNDAFYDLMKGFTNPEEVVEYCKKNFKMGEHKAFMTARLLAKAETILVSRIPDDIVRVLMMRPVHSVEEALEYVKEKYGGDYTTYVIPDGFLTVPFLKEE